eukprot:5237995-Alexandrium_andersonii.AAC.1
MPSCSWSAPRCLFTSRSTASCSALDLRIGPAEVDCRTFASTTARAVLSRMTVAGEGVRMRWCARETMA